MRILVTETIAAAGIDRLREAAEVDVATDLDRAEPAGADRRLRRARRRAPPRSVDAELIAAGTRLRVIGRAGTGVDNVDVEAATARGILVCNAPQSNALSAAEHAIALMLALARNIPQAHAALVAGRWERSRFSGVELADKTLAVIGFGRIGQLVAARARGLGMRVVTYDPFVSAERVARARRRAGRDHRRRRRRRRLGDAAPAGDRRDAPRRRRRADRADAAGRAHRERGPRRAGRHRRAGRGAASRGTSPAPRSTCSSRSRSPSRRCSSGPTSSSRRTSAPRRRRHRTGPARSSPSRSSAPSPASCARTPSTCPT